MVQRGLENAKGVESLFRETAKNFPKLEKDTNIHVKKGQRSLVKFNSTKSTSRQHIIKLSKVKDKEILKNNRKETTHMGVPICLTADFSAENLEA